MRRRRFGRRSGRVFRGRRRRIMRRGRVGRLRGMRIGYRM